MGKDPGKTPERDFFVKSWNLNTDFIGKVLQCSSDKKKTKNRGKVWLLLCGNCSSEKIQRSKKYDRWTEKKAAGTVYLSLYAFQVKILLSESNVGRIQKSKEERILLCKTYERRNCKSVWSIQMCFGCTAGWSVRSYNPDDRMSWSGKETYNHE